jgi:hypothetical protein
MTDMAAWLKDVVLASILKDFLAQAEAWVPSVRLILTCWLYGVLGFLESQASEYQKSSSRYGVQSWRRRAVHATL